MQAPDAPTPPPPSNPRLPLWFWGGLAVGLAALIAVAGLVVAGAFGRPAQPTLVPSATHARATSLALLPTPTPLPLSPVPTPLLPAVATTATASPLPTYTATPRPVPATARPAFQTVNTPLPPPPPPQPPTLSPIPSSTPTRTPLQPMPTRTRVRQATGLPETLAPTATSTPAPTATSAAQSLPAETPTALAPTATPTRPAPTATLTQAPIPAGLVPAAAVVDIVAVPADITGPYAITATVKYLTDTVVGPQTGVVALMTSGLRNVPLHVPVKLLARPVDPSAPGRVIQWQLTAPDGSAAKLGKSDRPDNQFTPDIAGYYKVDATLLNGDKSGPLGSVQIHAGTYIGEGPGGCATCHPAESSAWAKTGHARILTELIDNSRTPDVPTHYAETCIRCHTTGYYPGAANGGYAEVAPKAKYTLPTFAKIDAAGKKAGPSNWGAMPEAVKNLANVQCEDCHGPGREHAQGSAQVMQSSQAEGVCNQCHNGGGFYLKGTDLQNSAHAEKTALAWTVPTGPGEQQCVRCHSGLGYASFLADPKNPAGWDNRPQTVVCSTCHDPHSEANPFQLRIAGKPVELPFQVNRDVGLSATCYECHNARTQPADAASGQFPHYSSAAEFLTGTGGVDYGATLPNSPHGTIGSASVPNPAYREGSVEPQFLFSKAGDAQGNVPGPCVACHMWPAIEDKNDPNYHKVGSHSFNMVTPGAQYDYTAACESCHAGVKSFNIPSQADYDGNGKVEGVQDEVAGLLDVLWNALAQRGVQRINEGYPYATLPVGDNGKVDPKLQNAWYNFGTVYGAMWSSSGEGNRGKAQAIHNFKRSVALLQLAYRDLTGISVPGAEILVK